MDYQEKLKILAEDMSKEDPIPLNEARLRMEELNLKYSDDEIERFNQILIALHNLKADRNEEPKQERRH